MFRKSLTVTALGFVAFLQPTRLDNPLGPNGGVKVECIAGCEGGGGGGDVNITGVGGNPVTTTIPVSGSVSVSNFPATQPVTGTFWQEVQPVIGTFWQEIQPVSVSGGTISQATNNPGSNSVTLTTTATQLGTGGTTKILVQNDPDNSVDIFCGTSVRQDFQLKPGDALSWDLTNLNLVYCKSASGSVPANVIWR